MAEEIQQQQEQVFDPSQVVTIEDVVQQMDPSIIDVADDDYLSEFDNLNDGQPLNSAPEEEQVAKQPAEVAAPKEGEKTPTAEEVEAQAAEKKDDTDAEAEKKDGQEVAGKKDVDAETGKEKGKEAGDEYEPVETISDVAEALGLTVDALADSLSHKLEINGEEKEVKLKDLIDTYTGHSDLEVQTEEFKHERDEFQVTSNQAAQHVEAYTQGLVQIFNMIEGEAKQSLETPEMAKLKEEDPASYLLESKNIENQIGALNNLRGTLGQQYEQFQTTHRQQVLKSEGAYIQKADPEWSDKKFQTAWSTLLGMGYSVQEIQDRMDARTLLSAYELSELRTENAALKARIEAGAKEVTKIRKFPKLIKPGAGGINSTTGKSNTNTAFAKAQKSGSMHDAVAAVDEMMKVM